MQYVKEMQFKKISWLSFSNTWLCVCLLGLFAVSCGPGAPIGSAEDEAASVSSGTETGSSSTTTPSSSDPVIQRVLELVNANRAASGVAPLALNAKLSAAAQKFAQLMVAENFFSHTSPDGSSAGDRISAEGYDWRTWGENIAWGQATADAVMTAWMNSSGHRANILTSNFKEIGIGYYKGSSIYWVQDFGAQ